MFCPKCKIKLMTEKKESPSFMKVRCMKCGREYQIKKGRLVQQKKKRILKKPFKHVKKAGGPGITIGASLKKGMPILPDIEKNALIMRQLSEIQRLQRLQNQIKIVNRTRKKPK